MPWSLEDDVIGVVSVWTEPPELTSAGAALLSSELQSEGNRLELEEGGSCPDIVTLVGRWVPALRLITSERLYGPKARPKG